MSQQDNYSSTFFNFLDDYKNGKDQENIKYEKFCHFCKKIESTYWRKYKSKIYVCNSCGIRLRKYKKFCHSCNKVANRTKGVLYCKYCFQLL